MSKTEKTTECVKVAVRCRPLSPDELKDGREVIIEMNQAEGQVIINNPKPEQGEAQKTFTYDMIFDWNSKQNDLYDAAAYPIIENILEGYNGTIFAYGQTGTGKTYTMEGMSDQEELNGIIPRSFIHIFKSIGGMPNKQFLVRASFLELYNEEIRDLLSKNYSKTKLELREKPDIGVYVKDLSTHIIQNKEELLEKQLVGRQNRHVASTQMNQVSSRSHSVFSVIVECCEVYPSGERHITVGKLNLVDLAGSERQSKTGSSGVQFKEAININQSLTTLGNVISALVDPNKTHIPYRDSKLTRLLQTSLGGNTKTVMIAAIGPANYNYDETLSTLRYAYRAKQIKNQPKINEDPKDTMIREYQEEIQRLKDELTKKLGGNVIGINEKGEKIIELEKIEKVIDENQIQEIQEKLKAEKEEIQKNLEQEKQNILSQKNMADQEKKRLIEQIEQKEQAQEDIIQNNQNLLKKIKAMEGKLLEGNTEKEILIQKEKELSKAKQELENRKQDERRKRDELKRIQEEQEDAQTKFNSLQEEINVKTQKLNILLEKVNEVKQQKQEIQAHRAREKEILLEENREIMKEIKLLEIILENFIPDSQRKQLEQRFKYNEENDQYILQKQKLQQYSRPISAFNFKKSQCEFSKMALTIGEINPRFCYDNILQLDLDLPQRTTEDLTEEISEKVQETINVALNEDEEDEKNLLDEMKPNIYLIPNEPSVIEDSPIEKIVKRPQSSLKKKVKN